MTDAFAEAAVDLVRRLARDTADGWNAGQHRRYADEWTQAEAFDRYQREAAELLTRFGGDRQV